MAMILSNLNRFLFFFTGIFIRLLAVWWPGAQDARISTFLLVTLPNIHLKGKKVKFCHTRYRALGPELIPVYRQSARR